MQYHVAALKDVTGTVSVGRGTYLVTLVAAARGRQISAAGHAIMQPPLTVMIQTEIPLSNLK